MDHDWIEYGREADLRLDVRADLRDDSPAWLMMKIYREFRRFEPDSPSECFSRADDGAAIVSLSETLHALKQVLPGNRLRRT